MVPVFACDRFFASAQLCSQGIYTAGYVLMTLLINGPLLAPLMTWLKLNTISTVKKQVGWARWLAWVEQQGPPLGGGAYPWVDQRWRRGRTRPIAERVRSEPPPP